MGDVDKYYLPKPFRPVLPLVYDDALSYYEAVAQLVTKINELVDSVNNVTTEAVTTANAYTDEKVAEALSDVDEAVEECKSIASSLNTTLAQYKTEVNAQLLAYQIELKKFEETVDADLDEFNERTDLAIQQNNDYLIANMQKELGNIKVLNYFTGKYISVQDMFDYLAQFHLSNAIGVQTLVNRAKTVDELIAYNMTMTDLATNGATIITN